MSKLEAKRQALFACSLLIRSQLESGWDLAATYGDGSEAEQAQLEAEVRKIADSLQARSVGARS